ncbi:MAG: PilZ domain-containing protein [Candidatus Acidiferrales bacterium]
MPAIDRRLAPRKPFALPVRFRVRTSASIAMYQGETINLSDHGVYFRTPRPLTIGDALEVVMTLPSALTGRKPEEVRCDARVVHVDLLSEPGACAAVGVSIQRFERIVTDSRWAN